MIRWITVITIILLASASTALAQPFAATLGYFIGDPLTTDCEGATPLPDGYVVKIFWDSDSDGPDLEDPQPVQCTLPECIEPFLSVNFNEFTINGFEQGFGAGYFVTFDPFQSVGGIPSPARYYLRIYEVDNVTPLWTTSAFTLTSGYQDVYLEADVWTCGGLGPQCIVIDESE